MGRAPHPWAQTPHQPPTCQSPDRTDLSHTLNSKPCTANSGLKPYREFTRKPSHDQHSQTQKNRPLILYPRQFRHFGFRGFRGVRLHGLGIWGSGAVGALEFGAFRVQNSKVQGGRCNLEHTSLHSAHPKDNISRRICHTLADRRPHDPKT